MSVYSSIHLSSGGQLTYRNGWLLDSLSIFNVEDCVSLAEAKQKPARWAYLSVDSEPEEVYGFELRARDLKDRLDLTGISLRSGGRAYDKLREDLGLDEDFDVWCAGLREALKSKSQSEIDRSMFAWREEDPRHSLRIALQYLPDDEWLFFEFEDAEEWLVDRGEISAQLEYAREGSPPVIVVTEGSSDAIALKRATNITRPKIASYLRFLDFSVKAPGGAAHALNTFRGLASAGVSNKVILLLDNDSAGRDAVKKVSMEDFPERFAILHYPALPIAESYPTKGPTGDVDMDVNGLAGSIELYMGSDVLDLGHGLTPIQWTGFVRGVSAYQGEVLNKDEIKTAFWLKCDASERAGHSGDGDWSGMSLILDHLVHQVSAM